MFEKEALLFRLIERGDEKSFKKAVEIELNKGINLKDLIVFIKKEAKNSEPYNLLSAAAATNQLGILTYLIEKLDFSPEDDIYFSLGFAARNGHVTIIEALLQYPAVRACAIRGNHRILQEAAAAGHSNTVNYLLNYACLVEHDQLESNNGSETIILDVNQELAYDYLQIFISHLATLYKQYAPNHSIEEKQLILNPPTRNPSLFLSSIKYPFQQIKNIHEAFILAAENGHINVVNLFLFHPFIGKDISQSEEILLAAIQVSHTNISSKDYTLGRNCLIVWSRLIEFFTIRNYFNSPQATFTQEDSINITMIWQIFKQNFIEENNVFDTIFARIKKLNYNELQQLYRELCDFLPHKQFFNIFIFPPQTIDNFITYCHRSMDNHPHLWKAFQPVISTFSRFATYIHYLASHVASCYEDIIKREISDRMRSLAPSPPLLPGWQSHQQKILPILQEGFKKHQNSIKEKLANRAPSLRNF